MRQAVTLVALAVANSPTMKRTQRSPRGQAMVEYSMLNWVLVVALVLMSAVRIIPGQAMNGQPMSVIELFLAAYQVHYDTYLYSLSLPF
jgi:hypothetical protein